MSWTNQRRKTMHIIDIIAEKIMTAVVGLLVIIVFAYFFVPLVVWLLS